MKKFNLAWRRVLNEEKHRFKFFWKLRAILLSLTIPIHIVLWDLSCWINLPFYIISLKHTVGNFLWKQQQRVSWFNNYKIINGWNVKFSWMWIHLLHVSDHLSVAFSIYMDCTFDVIFLSQNICQCIKFAQTLQTHSQSVQNQKQNEVFL